MGAAAADGLRRVIELMDAERDEIRAGGSHERPADDASAGELLRGAIERISGLVDKHPVAVDVISPLLLAAHDDVENVGDLLAGDILGDFGGFLQADLRRSDFALGYASVLAWAPEGLAACRLPQAAVDATVDAVKDATPEDWEEVRRGEAGGRDLPWRARLRLAHFLFVARGPCCAAERARGFGEGQPRSRSLPTVAKRPVCGTPSPASKRCE